MTKSELYMDFLAEEGYRPKLDAEGDITFKHDGKNYVLWANEEDPQFFRLGALFIWAVDSEEERLRALEVANTVNRDSKVGKVFVVPDDVWVCAELVFAEPEHFKGVFRRALGIVDYCVRGFCDGMRAQAPSALGSHLPTIAA